MADAGFERAALTYSQLTQDSRDETAGAMIEELDRLYRKIFKGRAFKDAIRRMNMIGEGQLQATAALLAEKTNEMYAAGKITDELFLRAMRELATELSFEDDPEDKAMAVAFKEQWSKTSTMMREALFQYGPANGLSDRDLAVRKYEVGAQMSRWFLTTVGTVPWDRYFTPAISLFVGKLIGHAVTSPSGSRLSKLEVPYISLKADVAEELRKPDL